jgi:lysophospholipase L1-like esterase
MSNMGYGLWQYDKELGAIHASNSYNSNSETNSLGFRNHEDVFEPKPPGALRIIAYGGSTTFCYNLDTEHAWPLRLQALLRAHHNPGDQVLNAGAVMWSISHEITRAERDLPRLHPDYVSIYSGFNEEFIFRPAVQLFAIITCVIKSVIEWFGNSPKISPAYKPGQPDE